MGVWYERNTAYNDNNICSTTAISSGSVTVWRCFSFGCKLDMHVVEVYMNIEIYRDFVFRETSLPLISIIANLLPDLAYCIFGLIKIKFE